MGFDVLVGPLRASIPSRSPRRPAHTAGPWGALYLQFQIVYFKYTPRWVPTSEMGVGARRGPNQQLQSQQEHERKDQEKEKEKD